MATTPNGIYLMENDDDYNHTTINLISSSVDHALEERDPQIIHTVANEAERAALAASFLPTPARPLYVHRTNAGAGRQLEVSINGTTWSTISTEQDTGWVTVPITNTVNFELYSPSAPIRVRKQGNVVYLDGAVTLASAVGPAYITTATIRQMATLPAQFRPTRTTYLRSQGSGITNTWSFSIGTDGAIGAARYGPDDPTPNVWLPFFITYMVED